jgi:hypothetical protein
VIVIKDLTGKKISIPGSSVSSKKKQLGSPMPEPMALGLSGQDLADVAEYLMRLK